MADFDGGPGDDTYNGTSAPEVINGNGGKDTLNGAGGDDVIDGGDGDDIITGGTGRDEIHGGAGVDKFVINTGDFAAGEIYDGGADGAIVLLNGTNFMDLTTTTFTGITEFRGSSTTNNLRLTAAQLALFTSFHGGTITLVDGGVVRLNAFVSALFGTTINLAPVDTTFSLLGQSGSMSGDGALTINGNIGNDTIHGTNFSESIYGGDGNDTLDGGANGYDYLYGGKGDDTFYYRPEFVSIKPTAIIEYANEGYDTEIFSGSQAFNYYLAPNVERGIITGTQISSLNGNAGDNWLIGNSKDNILFGDAGNDRFESGGGADTFKGGLGDDTFVYTGIETIIENANEGSDTVEAAFALSLASFTNIENLTLTGTANIDATGDNGDNVLTGNAAYNNLYGGGGNDRLISNGGGDYMYGGTGDDIYVITDGTGQAIENAGEGYDTIKVNGSYSIANLISIENLRLMGTGNWTAIGNAEAQSIVGNDGNNLLDGGGGGDHMKGLGGNDVYFIRDANDSIVELAGNGDDGARAFVSYTLAAGVEVEHLRAYDPTGTDAIDLTGNEFSHDIQGNAGANVLTGGSGTDVIQGFAGNDTLFGGGGADIFTFASGTGQDTVGDFVSGTDKLDLSTLGFADFAAVQAAMHDVGGNAVIDLGGGNSITLTGFLSAQLQSGDVILGSGMSTAPAAAKLVQVHTTGVSGKQVDAETMAADWHVGMWTPHDTATPFILPGYMPML